MSGNMPRRTPVFSLDAILNADDFKVRKIIAGNPTCSVADRRSFQPVVCAQDIKIAGRDSSDNADFRISRLKPETRCRCVCLRRSRFVIECKTINVQAATVNSLDPAVPVVSCSEIAVCVNVVNNQLVDVTDNNL